jgi:hypothetical protein
MILAAAIHTGLCVEPQVFDLKMIFATVAALVAVAAIAALAALLLWRRRLPPHLSAAWTDKPDPPTARNREAAQELVDLIEDDQ